MGISENFRSISSSAFVVKKRLMSLGILAVSTLSMPTLTVSPLTMLALLSSCSSVSESNIESPKSENQASENVLENLEKKLKPDDPAQNQNSQIKQSQSSTNTIKKDPSPPIQVNNQETTQQDTTQKGSPAENTSPKVTLPLEQSPVNVKSSDSISEGENTEKAEEKFVKEFRSAISAWVAALDKDDEDAVRDIAITDEFLKNNINKGNYIILRGTLIAKNNRVLSNLLRISKDENIELTQLTPGKVSTTKVGKSIFMNKIMIISSTLVELLIGGDIPLELELRQAVKDKESWKVLEIIIKY